MHPTTRSSPASTIAPRRWATARAASSTTLGAWPAIAAEAGAIRSIHVSDAGHFGFARLRSAEHALEAFGYTVSNRHIGAVLWRLLRARARVELACPARVRALQLGDDAVRLRRG